MTKLSDIDKVNQEIIFLFDQEYQKGTAYLALNGSLCFSSITAFTAFTILSNKVGTNKPAVAFIKRYYGGGHEANS
jgi:hypothetical protein